MARYRAKIKASSAASAASNGVGGQGTRHGRTDENGVAIAGSPDDAQTLAEKDQQIKVTLRWLYRVLE